MRTCLNVDTTCAVNMLISNFLCQCVSVFTDVHLCAVIEAAELVTYSIAMLNVMQCLNPIFTDLPFCGGCTMYVVQFVGHVLEDTYSV